MRRVDPNIYTSDYYQNSCLGKDAQKRFHLDDIPVQKGMRILDIGCGKGDVAFFLAQKGANVVGIDYAKAAIGLAKKELEKQSKDVQSQVSFFVKDAKQLDFPNDYFDGVVSLDVFEHLYPEELSIVMGNISRVLKKDGFLFVHTEPNKFYVDVVHNLYVYPVSLFLVWVNRLFTRKTFPHLAKDPRSPLHKEQHVNEPTFWYLKNLFLQHKFVGDIKLVVPIKPVFSWKDAVYNVLVYLYPMSMYFPFSIIFGYDFVCIMRNNK